MASELVMFGSEEPETVEELRAALAEARGMVAHAYRQGWTDALNPRTQDEGWRAFAHLKGLPPHA